MRNCAALGAIPLACSASTIPLIGSLGVDGVLARTSAPVDSSSPIRSVKVPPVSIPIRTPICSPLVMASSEIHWRPQRRQYASGAPPVPLLKGAFTVSTGDSRDVLDPQAGEDPADDGQVGAIDRGSGRPRRSGSAARARAATRRVPR